MIKSATESTENTERGEGMDGPAQDSEVARVKRSVIRERRRHESRITACGLHSGYPLRATISFQWFRWVLWPSIALVLKSATESTKTTEKGMDGTSPHIAPGAVDDGGFAAGLGEGWSESRSRRYGLSGSTPEAERKSARAAAGSGRVQIVLRTMGKKSGSSPANTKGCPPPASDLVQYAG